MSVETGKKRRGKHSEAFKPAEAMRLTGVPYRVLNKWIAAGLLVPSIRHGEGHGIARLFSLNDILALRLMRQLRGHRLELEAITPLVRYVQDHPALNALEEDACLIIGGQGEVTEAPRGELPAALPWDRRRRRESPLPLAIVLPLGEAVAELREDIDAMRNRMSPAKG